MPRSFAPYRAGRRRWLGVLAGMGVVAVALAALLLARAPATAEPSPSPTPPAATGSPTGAPTPTPTVGASPLPSPTPTLAPHEPGAVAATTNGVLVPWAERERATRHPIAVIIDDHPDARPQSGLASADIVYQALAEGGVPRYLAVFQAGDAEAVGPVRSSRFYFVAWAAEWRALLAHVGGAPNSLAYLRRIDGRLVWNADEFRWGGRAGYFWRIRQRLSPHNVYSSTSRLRELAERLGATAPVSGSPWTFTVETPRARRPSGGSLVIPYAWNRVSYRYDAASNRYLRSVTREGRQVDAGSERRVAPANVIVLFMRTGRLSDSGPGSTNEAKGRLELAFTGTGRALVLRNGEVVSAVWSKKDDAAPTLLRYPRGHRLAGLPVPLVRGQIYVQVVPLSLPVSVRRGTPAPTLVDPR
ncbi:MAG TPA: DUF3048 domain-containing protein [Candidatus Limnocylindrales bacterium]|nr:DUF3048 domain-containing protein [Candidatus Limnocylindrales bacterium]